MVPCPAGVRFNARRGARRKMGAREKGRGRIKGRGGARRMGGAWLGYSLFPIHPTYYKGWIVDT